MSIKGKIIFLIIIVGIILLILVGNIINSHKKEVLEKSSEIELIKSNEFRKLLDLIVTSEMIDASGASTRNQDKYLEVSSQRIASKMIARGIADNNNDLIEKGIKAIEYGFEHQNTDGSFQYDSSLIQMGATQADLLEAGSFFLDSVGHSYLLIEQTNFAIKYKSRLDLLKPKILLSLKWLESNKEELFNKAEDAPNRLIFDALSFKLNGIILKDKDYQNIGDEFIKENLKMQRNEGVFLEHGGHDSSYQAVNLMKLQIYRMYSDNQDLIKQIDSALIKGMVWEKTRIKENGEIDVTGNTRTGNCQEQVYEKCKEVNYQEVALSLMYYAGLYEDKEAEKLAEKVINYALTQS